MTENFAGGAFWEGGANFEGAGDFVGAKPRAAEGAEVFGVGWMGGVARDENCLPEILIIAAGLSIQDPRERPMDQKDAAQQAHKKFEDPSSDFLTLRDVLTMLTARDHAWRFPPHPYVWPEYGSYVGWPVLAFAIRFVKVSGTHVDQIGRGERFESVAGRAKHWYALELSTIARCEASVVSRWYQA